MTNRWELKASSTNAAWVVIVRHGLRLVLSRPSIAWPLLPCWVSLPGQTGNPWLYGTSLLFWKDWMHRLHCTLPSNFESAANTKVAQCMTMVSRWQMQVVQMGEICRNRDGFTPSWRPCSSQADTCLCAGVALGHPILEINFTTNLAWSIN